MARAAAWRRRPAQRSLWGGGRTWNHGASHTQQRHVCCCGAGRMHGAAATASGGRGAQRACARRAKLCEGRVCLSPAGPSQGAPWCGLGGGAPTEGGWHGGGLLGAHCARTGVRRDERLPACCLCWHASTRLGGARRPPWGCGLCAATCLHLCSALSGAPGKQCQHRAQNGSRRGCWGKSGSGGLTFLPHQPGAVAARHVARCAAGAPLLV